MHRQPLDLSRSFETRRQHTYARNESLRSDQKNIRLRQIFLKSQSFSGEYRDAKDRIWLRDDEGTKLVAVSRNTALSECKPVSEDELPESLSANRRLKKYAWGVGQYKGQKVLFPWRLTMSKFTKEIVENTAKETARQILKMSGDKGWNRPVYIQVSTNAPGDLKVEHQGEDEIYVETKSDKSLKVKSEKKTEED